jgi:hypothetical protein
MELMGCLRKAGKWGTLSACAVIVVAFLLSMTGRWAFERNVTDRSTGNLTGVGICKGALEYWGRTIQMSGIYTRPPTSRWWRDEAPAVGFCWWPWWQLSSWSSYVKIPLWIPLALFAFPTGILWRRDHVVTKRALSRACHECSYDRRGLAADAPCPECGAPGSSRDS